MKAGLIVVEDIRIGCASFSGLGILTECSFPLVLIFEASDVLAEEEDPSVILVMWVVRASGRQSGLCRFQSCSGLQNAFVRG